MLFLDKTTSFAFFVLCVIYENIVTWLWRNNHADFNKEKSI